MNKTIKQAPPLLTAGQLKELLDDVFPDCIVHISGSGAVREIEVRNGKLYIKAAENVLRRGISELWSGSKTVSDTASRACTQESHAL